MITYNQVKDLPKDHPLMVAFLKEIEQDDLMHEELAKGPSPLEDEQSQAYFDRFIAGDR